MGPGKTIVANFTELSSSPLELEGWIAAEITFWSLVAPLQQLMLLSSLPTPAGSNLTLWSWQQLFCPAPTNFFLLVQIYKNFHEKFRTYTVFLWSFDWYTRNFWCKHSIVFNYNICGTILQRLHKVNDLGVIFDSKLLFADHIAAVRSKAMQMLGILYRFTDIRDVNALRLYYTSCVLPNIEYCSPVWSSAAESNLMTLNRVTSFFYYIVK